MNCVDLNVPEVHSSETDSESLNDNQQQQHQEVSDSGLTMTGPRVVECLVDDVGRLFVLFFDFDNLN